MNIINLTPHAISLANKAGGIVRTIEPSGTLARLVWPPPDNPGEMHLGDGIWAVEHAPTSAAELQGLPEPRPETVYLVSALCLDVAREAKRSDVLAPDTGATCVRKNGQVVAVRQFVQAYSPLKWVMCKECFGGHRRPCQACGDVGGYAEYK